MSDRPRTWMIPASSHQAVAPGEYVRVVEWDREKVEAAVARVISRELSHEITSPAALARAIFDALDPEGP